MGIKIVVMIYSSLQSFNFSLSHAEPPSFLKRIASSGVTRTEITAVNGLVLNGFLPAPSRDPPLFFTIVMFTPSLVICF
jgi:hypothetical protein